MQIVKKPLRYIERLCRNTVALVLAGGRGTRLQGLTRIRAKPATSYAGKYRIIDFTLSNCLNSGIRRVGVAAQYEAVTLAGHIQRSWGHLRSEMGEWVGLLPARQQRQTDDWYAGTADAVYQNLSVLDELDPDYLLILAGDHVYLMNYLPMLEQHVETGADITVGGLEVPAEIADQFGVLTCRDGDRVDSFVEKPTDPLALAAGGSTLLASMGIYVFTRATIRDILATDAADPASTRDFGKDVIPSLIKNHHVSCHRFVDPNTGRPGYWRDVGTVDAFFRGHMELVQPMPRINLYDPRWPVWSYAPHLPPAKLAPDAEGRRGSAQRSLLASGSIVTGAEVTGSVLAYQARVDRAEVEASVLLPASVVSPGCRLNQVILDEDVVLPPDIEIGYDAEADRARFDVTANGAVLVTRDRVAALTGED
jgi:glucose-1-phosphate adenylyltransferase